MKLICSLVCVFLYLNCSVLIAKNNRSKKEIKLLIVDGFSNHDWQRTTKAITTILKQNPEIVVTVSTSPNHQASKAEIESWHPNFFVYDVVLFNCNDLKNPVNWSNAARKDFEKFVNTGGGLYVFHAANNSFLNWAEYNKMIGMGWRNKNYGKAIIVAPDESISILKAGEGERTSHGKRVNALVTRLGNHSIHKGFPRTWLYADIEVYRYTRGPAENVTVLTYAKDERDQLNFPIEWIVKYGQGRVYNSSLGHFWKNQQIPEGLQCAAFQTEMIRAIQWLANQKICKKLPKDFPDAKNISLRDNL